MNTAAIVALASAIALVAPPVRQLIARRRYHTVARHRPANETERGQLQAARDFILDDLVRWNRLEAWSTAIGVALLFAALYLELSGGK